MSVNKWMIGLVGVGLACSPVMAAEVANPALDRTEAHVVAPPEVVEADGEESFWAFSAGVSLDFVSKQMTYGLVDNDDPIFSPAVSVGFGPVSLEAAMIWDLTDYGKEAGYGDHKGKYQELTFGPVVSHQFGMVEVGAGWVYEFHPSSCLDTPDTQFIVAEVGLPDILLAPRMTFEWDIDNESDAIYVTLEIGHSFAIIDDTLSLDLGTGLGMGNSKRNEYDFGISQSSLKDAWIGAALCYNITEWLSLTPYITCSFQVDPDNRKVLNADDADSTILYGGINLAAKF